MDTTQRNQILTRYQQHADRFEAIAASRTEPVAIRASAPAEDMARALSARELEVLELIAVGLANRDIAARLFVSVETVKSHVRNILAKLHADSRAHAVALGFRYGLVT